MSTVEWSELPPQGGTSVRETVVREREFASELRRNPGRWAVLSRHPTAGPAHAKATRIRKNRGVAWTAGTYEAAVRPDGEQYAVYVRYVDREAPR